MRTNRYVSMRFKWLANYVEEIVFEHELNLRLSSTPFEAERLCEDAKNICFSLRDAIDVLDGKEGEE